LQLRGSFTGKEITRRAPLDFLPREFSKRRRGVMEGEWDGQKKRSVLRQHLPRNDVPEKEGGKEGNKVLKGTGASGKAFSSPKNRFSSQHTSEQKGGEKKKKGRKRTESDTKRNAWKEILRMGKFKDGSAEPKKRE